MKVVSTVQARMGSTRLPGKTLMEISGRSVLQHIVDRIRRARTIDEVIVATSTNKLDDAIEELCKKNNIKFFRGPEENVQDRVLQALKFYKADVNVEMFADNPCPDPDLIDEIVKFYLNNSYDYVSNFIKTTFPPGLEVQVYRAQVLEKAADLSKEHKYKEHVSLYIYTHKDIFSCFNYEAPQRLRGYLDVHMELDTPEDFKFIKFIYDSLYVKNPGFTTDDILRLIDNNPGIKEVNKDIPRRWYAFREG